MYQDKSGRKRRSGRDYRPLGRRSAATRLPGAQRPRHSARGGGDPVVGRPSACDSQSTVWQLRDLRFRQYTGVCVFGDGPVRPAPDAPRFDPRCARDGAPFPYRAGQAARGQHGGRRNARPYSIASAPIETAGMRGYSRVPRESRRLRAALASQRRRRCSPAKYYVEPTGAAALVCRQTPPTPIAVHRRRYRHRARAFDADAGDATSTEQHRPTLLFSARSPDEFAYVDELHALQDTGKSTFDPDADREVRWSGDTRADARAGINSPALARPGHALLRLRTARHGHAIPATLTGLGVKRRADSNRTLVSRKLRTADR